MIHVEREIGVGMLVAFVLIVVLVVLLERRGPR